MDDLKEPTYDDAVVGLDLSPRATSFNDLAPSGFQGAVNEAAAEARAQENVREADLGFMDRAISVGREMPTVAIVSSLHDLYGMKQFEPDPNYGTEGHEFLLKEAQAEGLEEYLPWFQGVRSAEEFRFLKERAKSLKESRKTFEGLSHAWTLPWLASQVLDPVSLFMGIKLVNGGYKLGASVASGSWAGKLAINAAAGGAAAASPEVLKRLSGYPIHTEEIAQAAAFGMILGGLFGPMAKNPATAAEASAMVRIGRQAEQLLLEGPKVDPIIVSEEARLLRMETERQSRRGTPGELKPHQDAIESKPPILDAEATVVSETPVQQMQRGIAEADPDTVIEGVSRQLDETLGLSAPEQPKALPPPPHEEFPQYAAKAAEDPATPVPPALDAAMKDIAPPAAQTPGFEQLPTPANMAKNPNYIGDWRGADGESYRIMVTRDGDYRVTKVGKGTVGQTTDLKEAMGLIPKSADEIIAADVAGRVTEPGAFKPLRGGKYGIQLDPDDPLNYKILTDDGEEAGFVALKRQGSRYEVDLVEVQEIHRGQGLAQRAYDEIERELGIKMSPSGHLLDDGYKLWLKRNPEAVQFHQKVDDSWFSPKRIKAELAMVKENIESLKEALAKAEAEGKSLRVSNLRQSLKSQIEHEQDLKKAWKKVPAKAKTQRALSEMFDLAGDRLGPPVLRAVAKADVEEVLNRVFPKGFGKQVLDEISDGKYEYHGRVFLKDRLVQISMAADNVFGTVFHEAVHAIHLMGGFTQREWDNLVKHGKRVGALSDERLKMYEDLYGKHTPEVQQYLMEQEIVAHFAERYLTGQKLGSGLNRVFDKTIEILRKIRDALGIKGFRTYQDIFEDIRSGKQAEGATGPVFADDAQAANLGPKRGDDVLEDPDWRFGIKDSTRPHSAIFQFSVGPLKFKLPRFDMESVTGRSRNPAARLLSPHFWNNTVGMSDHSPTAVSAEMRTDQATKKYMTEFAVTYNPAWADWSKRNGVKPAEWFPKQREFREQVGMYVADREGLGANYDPAVKKLGDKIRQLLNDQLKDMQDPGRHVGGGYRPVAGSENIADNVNYLWRQFDGEKVRNKMYLHADGEVEKMIEGAIADAQPWLAGTPYLNKLAKGYLHTVFNQALGLSEDWAEAVSRQNFGKLKSLLKQTQQASNLTDDQIDDIISRWRTRPPESGMTHTKHKLFLSEDYVLPQALKRDGSRADLAFRDLLNNDVGELFHRYTRRVQGRVALAKIKVKNDSGVTIIDGITSDEEFDAALRLMRQYGADYLKGDPNMNKILDKDDEYMRFIYDRIKGVPDDRQFKEYAKWMRRARTFNITRLLGQVGVAQMGEFGQLVGQLGVRAGFSKVPGFRRMIDAAGDSRLRDQISAEMESIGIGGERLHGMNWNNLRDLGEMPFEIRPESSWERYLDNSLEFLQKATFEGSGMAFIQQQQLRAAGVGIANWFSNNFAKKAAGGAYPNGFQRRIAQLGIDPAMMDRIGQQLNQHAGYKQTAANKKLSSLNLQNWTDLGARAAFEEGIYRYSNKLIQQQDHGSMALWMSDPTAKTIFQFRGFPFQAWANQLQYNLHMRDPAALMAFVWGIGWNAAVRGAQITALAAGRSDGAEYREKYLTPIELAKAGFERGGMSSILPMVFDTALALGGQQGVFNARTTQQSQSIFANPSFGIIDDAQKGIGGLIDSTVRDRTMSQTEIRSLSRLIPLMNQLQFGALLSTMISDRPMRAPKQQPLL